MAFAKLLEDHLALLESHNRIINDLAQDLHQKPSTDPSHIQQLHAMRQRTEIAIQDTHACKLFANNSQTPSQREAPALPSRKRVSEEPHIDSPKRPRVDAYKATVVVPIVEFEDLTAETDARVRSAERRRNARLNEEPTAQKRKRQSGESIGSVEGRVRRLEAGKRVRKKAKKSGEVVEEMDNTRKNGLDDGVGKGNPKRSRLVSNELEASKKQRASGEEADDEGEKSVGRKNRLGTGKKRR